MTYQRATGWRGFGASSAFAMLLVVGAMHAAVAATESAAPAPLAPPPAGEYHLDKSHASALFSVSHMGFSHYTSRFSRFDATLNFDPAKLSTSRVVVTIDATSLEMDGAPTMCLDIARGAKLLDTARFPEITFRSESVKVSNVNELEISGSLTLHGVTRPLVLSGTYNGGYASQPMEKNARIGFSAHGAFNRSDFGMVFAIPAAGSSMGLGDRIELAIEVEFAGPAVAVASGS